MTTTFQQRTDSSSLLTVAFLMLCAVLWVLLRPYGGLMHDAQLYAVQALATLRPDIFNGDIFLRYGSQNDFTLFPRLYALLLREIGLERAAALLTLGCSLLWLAMGWRIALRLSNRQMALLALGLLISVKAWYGAYHVFRSGEMFLSARLPAEVLSLAAIVAFIDGRRVLAAALVLVAGVLHPLMALPIAALLVFMLAEERWGVLSLRALFPVVVFGGTAATIMLSSNDQADTGNWLLALQTRSVFLFPVDWRFEDWQHAALVLSTLGLAYASATSEIVSRFTSSMLLVGLSGIGLAAIAGALPDYDFLLKVQPWRWLWPASVAAIIVLPGTVEALWPKNQSSARRTCAILLVASWIAMDTFGGIIALSSLLIFRMQTRQAPAYTLRAGAWLILAATLASAFVTVWQCALYPLDINLDHRWIQRMTNALPTNSTAISVVIVLWLATRLIVQHRLLAVAWIAVAAAILLLVTPRAYRTWTTERFSPETYQVFAPWREIIPESSEVLWPDNPTEVWILLERRSFMSGEQLAGLLYSPGLIEEVNRRAEALEPLAAPGWWTMVSLSEVAEPRELTLELLVKVCRASGLDYVVASAEIEGHVATALFPVAQIRVYLYDCQAFGKPGTAA